MLFIVIEKADADLKKKKPKKKTLLTHLLTNSSLVAWHCFWTNASKSDGMKGRPADKRSLTLTNLKDEKLKQNNQTKIKKKENWSFILV